MSVFARLAELLLPGRRDGSTEAVASGAVGRTRPWAERAGDCLGTDVWVHYDDCARHGTDDGSQVRHLSTGVLAPLLGVG